MELADLRESYTQGSLRRGSLESDPIEQFECWFDDCKKAKILEPNAMILATVGATGLPSQRTVLLKNLNENGFVFYTNYMSRKGTELDAHPKASLLFSWLQLERQVIVQGEVERVSRKETEAYFASRPRFSQLGAWASRQSKEVESREVLEERFALYKERFEERDVPTPDFWGGYRVKPLMVEFWQGGCGRMHDRLRFERRDFTENWAVKRYSP